MGESGWLRHIAGSGRSALAAGALAAVLVAGCRQAPPQFTENHLVAAQGGLVDVHRRQIAAVLEEKFGTPDAPRVPEGLPLDIDRLRMAAGPAGYVKYDNGDKYLQRGLFRQHCASCHGITGNGQGPTAGVLSPYPRDFRPGVFKWKSTYLADKPTDDDLRRTLVRGIPGTAMPAFSLLDDDQLAALVEYVKYLSMRGQVERELMSVVADDFDFNPVSAATDDPLDPQSDKSDAQLVRDIVGQVATQWSDTRRRVVVPNVAAEPPARRSGEEIRESARLGRELFVSPRAKCTDCHGLPGGEAVAKDYDDWNARVVDFRRENRTLAASIEQRQARLESLPKNQRERAAELLAADERLLERRKKVAGELLEPQLARPRNLNDRVYRGGNRPIDLFRRVHQGIAGTPMPGHGPPRPGVEGALTEAEIWQLVDYLRTDERSPGQ